jgi:sigma-E factor negative regulatory protein RseC
LAIIDSHNWLNLQPGNSKNDRILNSDIKHTGFVKEVNGDKLIVNIVSQSACSSCHANGACSAADMQDKEIEISHFTKKYKPGQEVTVVFQQSQGFTAILWSYIVPFILVFTTLIVAVSVLKNELIGGLLALAILIPYYTTLYFFRHLLKKVFKFEVEEKF